MKPRHDRSALKVVKYKQPEKPRISIHGRCSRTQANEWRPAKRKTLTELAIAGKLNVRQFWNAYQRGMINLGKMARVLYSPTPEFSRFLVAFNNFAAENKLRL